MAHIDHEELLEAYEKYGLSHEMTFNMYKELIDEVTDEIIDPNDYYLVVLDNYHGDSNEDRYGLYLLDNVLDIDGRYHNYFDTEKFGHDESYNGYFFSEGSRLVYFEM